MGLTQSMGTVKIRVQMSKWFAIPCYILGTALPIYGIVVFAVGIREGFWGYWDLIFNFLIGCWLLWVGSSMHWMQIEDTGRSIRVAFGPGNYIQCLQKCGRCCSSEVEYTEIESVEIGVTTCEEGAGVSQNKRCDSIYTQAYCVNTINIKAKEKPCCCHSGIRKYGLPSEQEAQELMTFVREKASLNANV